jgi:hypothetical protein
MVTNSDLTQRNINVNINKISRYIGNRKQNMEKTEVTNPTLLMKGEKVKLDFHEGGKLNNCIIDEIKVDGNEVKYDIIVGVQNNGNEKYNEYTFIKDVDSRFVFSLRKKFKLLKDLPDLKKGAIFVESGIEESKHYELEDNSKFITYSLHEVENNSEFFEEIYS